MLSRGTSLLLVCYTVLSVAIARLGRAVLGTAFWTAIAFPVAYVPILARGFSASIDLAAVGYLLAVHALAVVGGQFYKRPSTDELADTPSIRHRAD
jgi:hypothetical protein